MWIRSQDRTKLMECNTFRITYENEIIFVEDIYTDTYVVLGEYSTEEKAMKVLDMIEEKYLSTENSFGDIRHYGEFSGVISTSSKFVFQMPLDEEVEI